MKHELVKWLCFDLIIGLMWVRTLVNPKLNSLFVKIYFGMKVKGHRKLRVCSGLSEERSYIEIKSKEDYW